MKRISCILAAASAMLLLTACPNTDPTPEPTPQPKPDVTVSLGTTARIGADQFVSEAVRPYLETASDGSYQIASTGDPFSVELEVLKGYDGTRPFKRYWNYPVSYNFQLGSKPAVPAGSGEVIDLTGILPASFSLGRRTKSTTVYFSGLPDGIQALDEIQLTPESRFELQLSMVSPFFTEGTMTASFAVDMRHFFGSPEAVDGELKFDAQLTAENGYKASKVFHLSDVAFDPDNYSAANHNVRVDARIVLSGAIAYEGMKTTRARLNAAPEAMQLNATVILYDLAAESFTGQFDYKTKAVSGSLKLQPEVAALGIDFGSSDVKLGVKTDLSYPFDATVGVQSKKNRVTVGSVSNVIVPLPVAEPGASVSDDVELDETADLSPLFAKSIDEMAFNVSMVAREGVSGTVVLGQTNTVEFKPALSVPLCLGTSFDQTFTETLSVPRNVAEALATKPLALTAEVANQLPMDVDVSVVLTDDTGREITRPVSGACAADKQSSVKATVNAVGSSASSITKAAVTFRVRGISNSRPIKPTDGLTAQLSVVIPGE